jgi:hypothetical protein
MVWLRLFIAAIALTISSDLSAWGQTQVNSPEGFYDCKGIANGANIRDRNKTLCCLQGQQVCNQCFYTKQGCEPQFGCDTLAKKDIYGTCCFDNQKDCGKCYYTKQGCEPQNGCGNTAEAQCGGCNLGNTAASYACGKCGDNTSCLGCDGVPFSGKVNTNCGCGQPAAGVCGCNLNITCCRAAAGGNECINFGYFETMRISPNDTTIQGFYSHTGSSHNFVNKAGPWCQQGSTICGSMRCYESGGIQFNTAILTYQASFNSCPLSNHGCFDPAATILLEGGTLVEASDVKVGDRIFNSLSGRTFAVKRVLVGPENLPMVEMGFDGHLLRVTQEHPVLTSDGMKRASTVKVGDRIVDAAGKERVLEYVRLAEIVEGQRVVNFELDVDSSDPIDRLIIADNMISGDLVVQQSKLPGEE